MARTRNAQMRIRVELYTADACDRCDQAKAMLRDVVNTLGEERFRLREINVVANIDEAVAAGIRFTPALRINGADANAALRSRQALGKALDACLHEAAAS